jgi:hypothetical protein
MSPPKARYLTLTMEVQFLSVVKKNIQADFTQKSDFKKQGDVEAFNSFIANGAYIMRRFF